MFQDVSNLKEVVPSITSKGIKVDSIFIDTKQSRGNLLEVLLEGVLW